MTDRWVLVAPSADFEKINSRFDEEPDLGHGVFECGRVVVGGIKLDADGKRLRHDLANRVNRIHDELGSVLRRPAICIDSIVGLSELARSCQTADYPTLEFKN